MSVGKRDYCSRLQILLVFLILNSQNEDHTGILVLWRDREKLLQVGGF